jgi:hypothetical protein
LADGVAMARGLFAEQPDSVLRLNALGYALIQRPEGLEEGYRLLWRGFNYGQTDYAVIDSLGWAYYLYGHFDQARALIERANDLSVERPERGSARSPWATCIGVSIAATMRAALASSARARPDAIRRRDLEQKLRVALTAPAPRQRRAAASVSCRMVRRSGKNSDAPRFAAARGGDSSLAACATGACAAAGAGFACVCRLPDRPRRQLAR